MIQAVSDRLAGGDPMIIIGCQWPRDGLGPGSDTMMFSPLVRPVGRLVLGRRCNRLQVRYTVTLRVPGRLAPTFTLARAIGGLSVPVTGRAGNGGGTQLRNFEQL